MKNHIIDSLCANLVSLCKIIDRTMAGSSLCTNVFMERGKITLIIEEYQSQSNILPPVESVLLSTFQTFNLGITVLRYAYI